MKNQMRKILALLLAAVLPAACSAAAAETRISVSGTGETRISADTAVISLGVSARDRDVQKAQQTVNENIAGIRQALLDNGVAEENINTDYMSIYAVGTLFVQLTLGMNAFITAQGFTKISMTSVLIGAVCNIALDPLFIFAFHMGGSGAALATVISQALSCLWVMRFLLGKKTVLHIRRQYMPLQLKTVLPCLALGLAPFIMQSSESMISMCFNSSLQTYGGDVAVGAMTILTSVMQFAMLPLQGFAQGAQPITSYNFGAGNKSRVLQSFRLLLTVSLTYSALLWGAIMLFPGVFASIFTPDPTLLTFSASVLPVYLGALVIFGIQIACQMTFVAIGNAKASIIVAVVRKFVLLLPLIYIMPALMEDKTLAVYTAEPVADVIAVTFTAILFFFQFRKALRSMDKPAEKTA